MRDLVSIIVPVYNAEKFILDTIDTVITQTYTNWELILVDDMSTDNSLSIIEEQIKEHRKYNIKLIKLDKKGLAAGARNKGIESAKGRYICYLDADDKWDSRKLEKQILFMKKANCAFSYTGYEFANQNCIPSGIKVKVPKKLTYKQALRN